MRSSIAARFNTAVSGLLKTEEVSQSLGKLGSEAFTATSAEFTRIIRQAQQQWGPIVKASGFTAEN